MCSPAIQSRSLSEVETQISTLRQTHETLTRSAFDVLGSLRDLQAQVARIHNSKQPVFRLPPDVLVLIFQETCNIDPRWTGMLGILHELPLQVYLSHVCSLWREVAIGTTSLWTTILFPMVLRETPLIEYLRRSKGAYLNVFLGPWSAKHPQLHRIFVTHLLPRLSQFRQLVIDTERHEDLAGLLRTLSDTHAPSLRRLRIVSRGQYCMGPVCEPIPIFSKGAPQLSDVRLDGIPVYLPDSQAKTLHLCPIASPRVASPIATLHRLLFSFPNLTSLHIKGYVNALDHSSAQMGVHLPCLKELLVHGSALVGCGDIFSLISTPNLEVLTFVSIHRYALAATHQAIARGTSTSLSSLRTLRYVKCDFGNEFDVSFMHMTPSVTDLFISLDAQAVLLRTLLNSDKQALLSESAALWPSLRHVTIHTGSAIAPLVGHALDLRSMASLFCGLVLYRHLMRRPFETFAFEGSLANTFYPAFSQLFNEASQTMHVVNFALPAGYKATRAVVEQDWAAEADGYGVGFRQLLGRLQMIRQQVTPLIPPYIHNMRKTRTGAGFPSPA